MEPGSADEARSREVKVEQPHDAALREREREGFEFVELARSVATPDHRSDGTAGDDVRNDALALENPHDADMRPAAGGAASER